MELKKILFKNRIRKQHPGLYDFCKRVLGVRPRNMDLYCRAITHKSSSYEDVDGKRLNNERLEYLGDAMLSAIVAEYLYAKYPKEGEGYLTELRSKIVSRKTLNRIAHKMGLGALMVYNKSMVNVGENLTMEGNALEALIGAVYLDYGYRCTRKIVVEKIVSRYTDVEALAHTDWNYKGILIDYCQKRHKKITFELENTVRQGHDHHPVYFVRVVIDGEPYSDAQGLSIKSAEQLAAERTYKNLKEGKNKNGRSKD